MLIEKFAAIDGVELVSFEGGFKKYEGVGTPYYNVGGNEAMYKVYDPVNDDGLNCKARDKYKVNVDYQNEEVYITAGSKITSLKYFEYINLAVINCIVKSES
jgi:hypothetical protein